jgi:hypothetical protein
MSRIYSEVYLTELREDLNHSNEEVIKMRSLLTAHKEENKRLKQETVQLKAIIK